MPHQRMTLMDRCFYIGESEKNQKHVGGIFSATYAQNRDYRYLEQLVAQMRQCDTAIAPFNSVVKSFVRVPYGFAPQKKLDMSYHIQLHELDGLDNKEVCNQFVAELHSQLLDRDKPMWQLHLIYDKNSENFIIYARVHHIYGDGISMVRWVMTSLTETPCESVPPFWQLTRNKYRRKLDVWWKRAFALGWSLLVNTKDMLWLNLRLWGRIFRINKQFMPIPFSNPHTVLTGNMESGRVLTTTKLSMDEITHTAKQLRSTVNELMLTTLDMALQQFLKDHGNDLSKQALTCIMPISLRKKQDNTDGNKIALAFIELAKEEHDPVKRLRQIIASTKVVKDIAHQVKPMAFIHFNLIWQVMAFAGEVVRLSNLIPPLSNILVSNVPGPQHDCFFGECKVNTFFPISTLPPGGGINITLVSYNGNMDIGFVCCNKNVRSLEPLAEYTQRAFRILQQSIQSTSTDIDQLPKDELFVKQDIGRADEQPGSMSAQIDKKIA